MEKRRIFWLVSIGVLAATLTNCSRTPQQGSAPQGQAPTSRKYRIAVVPKGIAHQFWLTVKAGAEKAGQEEGVEILWKGPSEETDTAGQIAILENFITSKVDAIVMAACDSKALIPIIRRSMREGIPVITIDSGVDSDDPLSFIATDNLLGAQKACQVLARLVGEKGKVGIIPFVPGAATSTLRVQGFLKEMKKHPGLKLAFNIPCYGDAHKAMSITEDALTQHPDLAGIFAANEPGALGAARALEQHNKAGEVKLVAFDAAEAEIEALKKGTIQALIVQNPFQMGYLGVKKAIDAIEKRPVPKRIDTGVTVVTKENLNQPEIQKLLYPLGRR